MSFKEFTQQAIRTESIVSNKKINLNNIRQVLMLIILSNKILDLLKKNYFYNKDFNIDSFKESMKTIIVLADDINYSIGANNTKFNGQDELNIDSRIFHALIGVSTESGELIEALLKSINNNIVDSVNIMEEFGDIDWYKAIAFDALGLDEDVSRERVIAKLRARYPDKFSNENAVNRNLQIERQILEHVAGELGVDEKCLD